MHLPRPFHVLGAIFCLGLAACASPSSTPTSQAVQEYLTLLDQLKSRPTVNPNSPEAEAGIARFTKFFSDMTEESVRGLTRETYAPDAFFNDTLKTVRGADAIEHYFLETVKNAESVRATVQDVSVSDGNYYVRWTMDVRLAKFKRGQTLRSIGITHLRFDDAGRILIHQDYWDSTGGFFEHLPVVGGILRAIKSRI
jgi:hypothetical protein